MSRHWTKFDHGHGRSLYMRITAQMYRHVEHACIFLNMVTSSNGNIFRVTGHLCGEFTGHRWIPSTKASDAEVWCFLWSAPWINGWVNNGEAGDLRRHRAHHDVTVMNQNFHWIGFSRPSIGGCFMLVSVFAEFHYPYRNVNNSIYYANLGRFVSAITHKIFLTKFQAQTGKKNRFFCILLHILLVRYLKL